MQLRTLGPSNVAVRIENRGIHQRKASREVRLDPSGLVVAIVIEDPQRNGPIRQTPAREFSLGWMY